MGSANSFNGSRATFSCNRVEPGGTHGDHLDRSVRLNGSDGVTGIDRTLEGVGAFYRDDLGDLVNVQGSGNARQDVFAVGSGGSQDVAVALAQLCNQRSDVFRQLVSVGSVIGYQHFSHASDFRSGFSHGASALASDQHVDVTTDFGGSSNGVQRGRSQHFVVVFSNNQDSHLDYLRFVFQFLDQFSHRLDLDTRAACSWRFDFQGLVGGGGGNA
ncbi:hypothetical protein D9M70_409780 [compost metagenome]